MLNLKVHKFRNFPDTHSELAIELNLVTSMSCMSVFFTRTLHNLYFSQINQLEDDIISAPGFVSQIKKFIVKDSLQKDKSKWLMMEFSELGFIGKLFKNKDLPHFINVFLTFASYQPIDYLYNYVFHAFSCDPNKDQVN